jgi:hypothetical protein
MGGPPEVSVKKPVIWTPPIVTGGSVDGAVGEPHISAKRASEVVALPPNLVGNSAPTCRLTARSGRATLTRWRSFRMTSVSLRFP